MKNNAVKYGIITGILTIIYTLVFYFMDKAYFLNPTVTMSSMIIHIAFMVKAAREERTALNFKMSFKEGIKPAFTVYVIASCFFYAFSYVMHNFIDPELTTILWEMGKLNGHSENIEDYKLTLFLTIFGVLRSFIFGFILSLIIAVSLKTE